MIAEIALDMFRGNLSSPPNCFSPFPIAVGESATLSTTSLREIDVYFKSLKNKGF
jgi:hypothetical protein